jgi:hypothetical protein
MGVMEMIYGFSTSFHRKQMFFVKPKANPYCVLRRNSTFYKARKCLCTTPKHLTEIQYGPHGKEIRRFDPFSLRANIFVKMKG